MSSMNCSCRACKYVFGPYFTFVFCIVSGSNVFSSRGILAVCEADIYLYSMFISVVASVVFCFRLPAQYAIVRYQKDDNYGITSCNWLHENHTMTYWPKKECNAASWLKSRKWMTDVRKHFKAYEVEVVKYAGVLPLFVAVISVGDRLFSNEQKCVLNS